MASSMFTPALVKALTTGLELDSADIRVMLVKSTYTFDGTDEFVSDLGAVDNGRSAALGSKTTTAGVFDAADSTLTATAAAACNALVIFEHTGSDATAELLAYIDVAAFTPSASQAVPIAWDNGSSKIFRLLAA